MNLLDLFRKPTARQLAKRDLEDARRWLHHFTGQVEANQAQVEMYRKRVKRLEGELKLERVDAEPVAQGAALAVVNG